jgi:hypothetical protein
MAAISAPEPTARGVAIIPLRLARRVQAPERPHKAITTMTR